jgi:hypothetical protein
VYNTLESYKITSVVTIALVFFSIPNAYADNDFEESIGQVFDFINEVVSPSIQNPDFDNSTQTNFQETLDSGTDAGKKGVSLWFGIHEFFVNLIFASSTEADLPIDRDIIVIVSMLAVFALMIGLVMHLIKENTKIALIVIAILIILAVVGIGVEF